MEKIRGKLYGVINNSYVDFLHSNSNLTKEKVAEISKNLPNRFPFHWKIDFEKPITNGGFDVVIGNPPYIEDRDYSNVDLEIINFLNKTKGKKVFEPLLYYSKDCGNTHAYFIERSIKLLKSNGKFGFIVPIALVSTDRMDEIREFILKNSSDVKYYNFDDRPGKIFSGLEHCRSTIVIVKKGMGLTKLTTSKYHRWYTKNRVNLFKDLKIIEWSVINPTDTIPKIGTETEKKILIKLEKEADTKTIKDFLEDNGTKIWYHNAPQYWIHSHTDEYLPKVEYYDYEENDAKQKILSKIKKIEVSSHYKSLIFDKEKAVVINCLLNSSLFYWWFVIWSDGRDLLNQHIENFPINIDNFSESLMRKLEPLSIELMESYEKNSNSKINFRSGGYAIKLKEIIPLKSKNIINQIDEVFADYFGFSEDEKKFIKQFDLEFRTKELI